MERKQQQQSKTPTHKKTHPRRRDEAARRRVGGAHAAEPGVVVHRLADRHAQRRRQVVIISRRRRSAGGRGRRVERRVVHAQHAVVAAGQQARAVGRPARALEEVAERARRRRLCVCFCLVRAWERRRMSARCVSRRRRSWRYPRRPTRCALSTRSKHTPAYSRCTTNRRAGCCGNTHRLNPGAAASAAAGAPLGAPILCGETLLMRRMIVSHALVLCF